MKTTPFPFPLNIGTDIVHLPRITRLINRNNYLHRFTRRILNEQEQQDFRTRFGSTCLHTPHSTFINADMARWLAGRFAAKEAARKAAPAGAASISWKDVLVRVETNGRPEVVYLDNGGGRVGRLSISHDGEYVVATVLAAG